MSLPRQNGSGYDPIEEPHTQEIVCDFEENVTITIYGFTNSLKRKLFYYIVSIILLGIPIIILNFFPKFKTIIKYKKCALCNATKILVKDKYNNVTLCNIKNENAKLPNLNAFKLRYFIYQQTKYVWKDDEKIFNHMLQLITPLSIDNYLNNYNGLFDVDYIDLLKFYGFNEIKIQIKSYWKLFIEEIFNYFYIFQAFSITLWCFDNYMIYATCVFILTLFSIVTSLVETRRQSIALKNLVESSKCDNVQVIRRNLLQEDMIQTIDPIELVPGDLIILPKTDFILPCDCLLLNGQCTINESMLTGESVPVIKTPPNFSNEPYNINLHKRHTLFSGTHLIQSRYYRGEKVFACVVRTGYNTIKGALIKSILYPTPIDMQFYKDSVKFVCVLFLIASIGTGYCLYLYIKRHAEISEIIIRSLDIITIVVPPALPAAMTIGINYSQTRLKKLKIFCISPPRINVCGKIKLACFDKTGTLTHDGLDLSFVIASINATLLHPIQDHKLLEKYTRLIEGMATCHSLTRINGQLNGDPLDLSMFNFIQWDLEEPGDDENSRYDMLIPTVVMPSSKDDNLYQEIGIIRQFSFSSTLQCMSVICRRLNSTNMIAFTKGAPEKLITMCQQNTIPSDFNFVLTKYATKGYRVIAIAYKDLPDKFKWMEAQRVKREIIECDLNFLGLLIFQNPLKPETAPILNLLHNANIKTVMITGDNILTAISVAHDCKMVRQHDEVFLINLNNDNSEMIPNILFEKFTNTNRNNPDNVTIDFNLNHYHLAVDGKTWSKLIIFYPDLIPHLLVRTIIFARFKPDQKTQLINLFKNLNYIVSMVGDGANDCGALKAAHVGISLSQAEASVAAPFTSSIQNISCIIYLILEGRCALVSSFAVFKFMALYSLIQFITVLVLYRQYALLGDAQFLYIDLVITTVLAVTIGNQDPSTKLCEKRPMASLVSPLNLIPLILQVTLCILIQLGGLYYLIEQEWYKPLTPTNDEIILCWDNTVLFTISCFQYVIIAFVYSKGPPYRQNIWTNFWFLISTLILTIVNVYLMIMPSEYTANFFQIIYIPKHAHEQIFFRYKLLLFPLIHLFLSILIEYLIADKQWLKKFIHFIKGKKLPKNKYKFLLNHTNEFNLIFNSSNEQ